MQSSQTGAKKVLSVVASIALAFAGTVGISSPAHAADLGKVYLNFETADTLGAAAANQAFEDGSAVVGDTTNLTGKSLKFTKGGAKAWSGVNLLLSTSTPYLYADATSHTITLDYWSNDAAPTPVMLKLETSVPTWQGGPSVSKALEAQPGLNTLSFDMSTGTGWDATKQWVVAALFPNFADDDTAYAGAAAAAVTGQVYEIDNISINAATAANVNGDGNSVVVVPGGAEATLMTFETDDALGGLIAGAADNAKPQGGFEGAETSIADAPAAGNGGKALKIIKKAGGAVYAGVNMIKFGDDARISDASKKLVTFNYYSAKANSPVRLELTPYPVALGVNVTATKQGWQTLSFDLSTATGNSGAVWSADTEYRSMALFPDFNNPADDSVYYVDNFAINGASTPAIVVPRAATSTVLTFETSDALGALAVGAADNAKPQGGFEGAETSIAAAPAGGNGGNALKIIKKSGGAVYAGVNMLKFAADTRITNGSNKIITFNYYSAKANSPTRLELVPYPVALGVNVTATKQGWQTLSFDLSTATGNAGAVWSADTEYAALTFFPDFNMAADNSVYYIDNLAFNGATTPALPVVPTTVAPTMRTAASVSGTAKIGKTLTVSKGSWTGTPTPTYSYKWYRCTLTASKAGTAAPTSSAKCSTISGKTSTTYKLASADKGKYIRVLVTVKNSKGTKYSLTKSTGKVS